MNIFSLAGKYLRYKDQFDKIDPSTIEELHRYVRLETLSIPVPVHFLDEELNDFHHVKECVKEKGYLPISTLHNNSRLFPGLLNLGFRAIHDWVHIQYDLPFDFYGEYKTWLIQAKELSYPAKQVLFSEIVLQTAYYVTYGSFMEDQKIVLLEFDNL